MKKSKISDAKFFRVSEHIEIRLFYDQHGANLDAVRTDLPWWYLMQRNWAFFSSQHNLLLDTVKISKCDGH